MKSLSSFQSGITGILDKDGDGKIASGEAVKFVTDHVRYTKKFGELDRDNDGFLRQKEISEGDPALWKFTVFSLPLN